MSRLLLSCLAILFFASINAQQQTPPKKASKIIVLVKDSGNTLFDQVTKTLFDYGYSIENKDEKLKLLSTKERSSKKYNTLTKIRASINDTAIIFRSDIALGFSVDLLGT